MTAMTLIQHVPESSSSGSVAPAEDLQLVAALRTGDERAFAQLVERYHASMARLAMRYVGSYAVAEEVVQETWLGVLQGLDRFAGRSTLKTWIFRILVNIASRRGQREHRYVPFSQLESPADGGGTSVDPERFGADGHWIGAPMSWADVPEERFLAAETQDKIRGAIDRLPERQQQVITLRDVEGWTADEVCELLAISDVHQRVLLHRARSSVRQALEIYITDNDLSGASNS